MVETGSVSPLGLNALIVGCALMMDWLSDQGIALSRGKQELSLFMANSRMTFIVDLHAHTIRDNGTQCSRGSENETKCYITEW